MIRRPPRSTPNYTRYPYTTRCRSGGDEGSGPQDCSLGQALRLQFPVEVSDLYGRLSTHVAYISGESAGKFQFCLGECFGRSAPRFLHHLAKLVWIIIVGIQEIGRASCRERMCQYVYISVVAGKL